MTIGNWISIAGALISFCSFLLAARQARQSRKASTESQRHAEDSLTESRRASEAAEGATHAQRRIATALENLESKYSIPWEVKPYRGVTYTLTNTSDEPAFHVTLVHDSPVTPNRFKVERLGPGEDIQFTYIGVSASGSHRRMTVEWTRPSETQPRAWSTSVPTTSTR